MNLNLGLLNIQPDADKLRHLLHPCSNLAISLAGNFTNWKALIRKQDKEPLKNCIKQALSTFFFKGIHLAIVPHAYVQIVMQEMVDLPEVEYIDIGDTTADHCFQRGIPSVFCVHSSKKVTDYYQTHFKQYRISTFPCLEEDHDVLTSICAKDSIDCKDKEKLIEIYQKNPTEGVLTDNEEVRDFFMNKFGHVVQMIDTNEAQIDEAIYKLNIPIVRKLNETQCMIRLSSECIRVSSECVCAACNLRQRLFC